MKLQNSVTIFAGAFAVGMVFLTQCANASLELTAGNDLVNSPFFITSALSPSDLADALGINASLVGGSLYKQSWASPANTTEEGPLAGSYQTIIDTDVVDGAIQSTIAHIKWVPGTRVADATYLVLKDGGKPGQFVWNLDALGWDGKEDVNVADVLGKYNISHVEFFGSIGNVPPPNVVAVPEPGTVLAGVLLLLPFGVSTIRTLRRNRAE